jgi:hypothetical protein
MYLSATNMPARKHLTAARVNSLSVGREASALQAEANIVTDADFVTQSELFDMRGWRMLHTLLRGAGTGLGGRQRGAGTAAETR